MAALYTIWRPAVGALGWVCRLAADVRPPAPWSRATWRIGDWTVSGVGADVRDAGADGRRAAPLPVARRYVASPAWYGWAESYLTPSAWAVLSYRLSHRLWCSGFPSLALVVSLPARISSGADIHPQAFIGCRFRLAHGFGVVIGATAEIGDDCLLLHGVTLGVRHVGQAEPLGVRVHPRLGDRVRVGAGAVLLGPITVGDEAQIGANSVVLHDVPPGATAVGAPARIIPATAPGVCLQAQARPGRRLSAPAVAPALGAGADGPDGV